MTEQTENSEKTTAVALIEQAGLALNNLDFNDLNSSINKLGEETDLSDKDKETGVSILGEWKHNVLDKLHAKRNEIQRTRDFIRTGDSYHFKDEKKKDMQLKLSEIAEAQKEFEAMEVASEAELNNCSERPERPLVDPDKTICENDMVMADYEKELSEYLVNQKRLAYTFAQKKKAWMRTVRTSPQIKLMLGEMDDYLLKITKYETECKDKAQLAKINIAISSTKTREAIREMINFTTKLN